MCAVSMISDYYMRPVTIDPTNIHAVPNSIPVIRTVDDETKKMLLEVIKRLDEIDKRLNDKECMDETKAEFYKEIGYKE